MSTISLFTTISDFRGTEVALQREEMRTVKWMCGVKLQERVSSKRLGDRLGLDWEYEVWCARPTGRSKKTWREIVKKDCQARKLNR